jgi:putative heme transporter
MDEPDSPGQAGETGRPPRDQQPRGASAGGTASASERRLAWLARRRRERNDDRLAERFAGQWAHQLSQQLAQARAQREHVPEVEAVVPSGPSNFTRAQVPHGVDLAAAWSWRFLVIVAAGWVVMQGVAALSVVVLPLIVALLLAALAGPAVHLLARVLPRGVASLLVLIGIVGLVSLMLTFATQQVVDGFTDISEQVVVALDRIQEWLRDGPLNISDQQVSDLLEQLQELVASSNQQIVSRVTEVGFAVGHIVAGFFIVLFALYFFMADGDRIWTWTVRLFPRAARSRADSSGRVAWLSLTQFVRATVLVAAVDAIGIMIVAAVLQVPFVMAIGVLVFLGAFVPIVGATVTGLIAVLVALVAQGPLIALFMLLGVVGVQQVESNVLQPFLLGRMVSIHPLAVILAVASGVLLAGVTGALVAVPLLACVNAVAMHLSGEHQSDGVSGALLTDAEEAQAPGEGEPS